MKHDKGLYLFTTLILVAFGVCAWWLFYPYKPIVVDYIKIVDKEVLPGQPMTYEIKYHKKMAITGVLSRKLKNTFTIELGDVHATAKTGEDVERITIPIPRYADPGNYVLWWSVTYQVNPLRKVTVEKESNEFTVLCNPVQQGKQGKTGPQGKQGDKGEPGSFFGKWQKGDKGDPGKNAK